MNNYVQQQIDKIEEDCKQIKPLVAIRCITYNHEPYIRDALEGFVIQKTSFPFVAIVHDDASTDRTADIIREYAAKYPDIIKPIYETENQYSKRDGSLGRIIREASEATGAKYYAECEGDDYWTDPLKLQKQVDFLESHPDYSLVYGKVQRFIQRTGKLGPLFGSDTRSIRELIQENTIPTPTVLFKREIADAYIRDVRPSEKKWLMGDFPLWLYCASKGKFHFIDEILAHYRVLPNSASHSNQIELKINFEESYFSIQKWFNERYELVNPSVLRNKHYIRLFEIALVLNNKDLAISYYKEIEKPNIKVKLKYWGVRMHIISIFKIISLLKGYK